MIETRQLYRLLTFGYENLLPNILSFWVLTIIPEIMIHNFGVTDKEEISLNCGYFFAFFYAGIVLGAFIWPTIVRFLSKRTSVFVGLLGMCVFNYFVGISRSLPWVFFYRFMTGLFHNFNSVGKDFVFQFARPSFRQYSFSIKTLFGFLAGFVGPYFGFWIYNETGKDFEDSMYIITLLFVFGLILFVVVFYLDFTPGDATYDLDVDEEEVRPMVHKSETDLSQQKGILQVLRLCAKNTYLRNLSIVYFLTNGVYKTASMIAILYIETPWADQGYGINNEMASTAAFVAFFPAAFMVLVSPTFVPEKVSYKAFIRFFIVFMMLAILAFPVVRDLIPESKQEQWGKAGLVLLLLLFMSVPKLYSPFINFNLNNAVDKYSRTALNSITFIFSTSSAALFAACIFPVLGWSLYNPMFQGHVTWSKYLAFVMLDVLLALTMYVLSKI